MMALVAALAIATNAKDLAGDYRAHQIEVGAELLLKADGTFLYSLDYGAVSEAGQGHWSVKDGEVRLQSDPLSVDLMREIERTDAKFQNQRLPIDKGDLLLQRWDTVFKFSRDDE
jgi:hypothetical protein